MTKVKISLNGNLYLKMHSYTLKHDLLEKRSSDSHLKYPFVALRGSGKFRYERIRIMQVLEASC